MNPVSKKISLYSWILATLCFTVGGIIILKTYGYKPFFIVNLLAAGFYFRITAILFTAVQEIKGSMIMGVPLTEEEIINMQAQSDLEHAATFPVGHNSQN